LRSTGAPQRATPDDVLTSSSTRDASQSSVTRARALAPGLRPREDLGMDPDHRSAPPHVPVSRPRPPIPSLSREGVASVPALLRARARRRRHLIDPDRASDLRPDVAVHRLRPDRPPGAVRYGVGTRTPAHGSSASSRDRRGRTSSRVQSAPAPSVRRVEATRVTGSTRPIRVARG